MKLRSHSALPQAKNGVVAPHKRRKVEKRNIYLPRDVIFNILLNRPAKLLYEVAKYVCKQWYDIVNDPSFIKAHCQMPTTTTTSASFIIQSRNNQHEVYCAELVIAKSFKVTTIQLPFPAIIKGSCNGIVLLCDVRDEPKVHLMNPLTKLMFSLPPVELPKPPFSGFYSFAVNSSGQYKVVNVVKYMANPDRCEINLFTIGVDKAWRPIDLQHSHGITIDNKNTIYPLVTCGRLIAGFIYWCSTVFTLMAMDVDTETFYQISLPTGITFCHRNYLFSMETTIGLITLDLNKRGIWTLQKLTDLKSSEWTEISRIDFRALLKKISDGKWTDNVGIWTCIKEFDIQPVSLIDGEFCFYVGFNNDEHSWLIRYNLAKDSFVSFKINVRFFATSWFDHVPTLVSPKIPSE